MLRRDLIGSVHNPLSLSTFRVAKVATEPPQIRASPALQPAVQRCLSHPGPVAQLPGLRGEFSLIILRRRLTESQVGQADNGRAYGRPVRAPICAFRTVITWLTWRTGQGSIAAVRPHPYATSWPMQHRERGKQMRCHRRIKHAQDRAGCRSALTTISPAGFHTGSRKHGRRLRRQGDAA